MNVNLMPIASKLLPRPAGRTDELTFGDLRVRYDFRYENRDEPLEAPRVDFDASMIDPKELTGWMNKHKLKGDVVAKVTEFFQQVSVSRLGRLKLPGSRGKRNSDGTLRSRIPTVLWMKKCKRGKVLKFGVNLCQKVGKGSRVSVYKIPVVRLNYETGDIQVKPRALIVHAAKTRKEFLSFVYGYEKGINVLQRVTERAKSPFVAPAPRRLKPALGLYTQRFLPGDIHNTPLTFAEKLQVLEDAALGLWDFHRRGCAHFDCRKENIAVVEQQGQKRGCLIDFNCSEELSKEVKRCPQPGERSPFPYPYRDSMLQHTSPRERFFVTMASDLTGLAQVIAELILPEVTWTTSHGAWLTDANNSRRRFINKSYYSEESDRYPPRTSCDAVIDEISKSLDVRDPDKAQSWAVGQIFDLVHRLFLKEQEYARECLLGNIFDGEEAVELSEKIFGEHNALWVAEKLKQIRLAITEKSLHGSQVSSPESVAVTA